jgi:hypothetical protein
MVEVLFMGIKWPEPETELSPSSSAMVNWFQFYLCATILTFSSTILLGYDPNFPIGASLVVVYHFISILGKYTSYLWFCFCMRYDWMYVFNSF